MDYPERMQVSQSLHKPVHYVTEGGRRLSEINRLANGDDTKLLAIFRSPHKLRKKGALDVLDLSKNLDLPGNCGVAMGHLHDKVGRD